MSNELQFALTFIGVIGATAAAILQLKLIFGLVRRFFVDHDFADVRHPGDYRRPVAIEVEKPKLKNEPEGNGYGIWLTDDEAQELGLGYDWREQVQQMREE